MSTFALTELLGAPVLDAAGKTAGHLRELVLSPQEDRARVSSFIVKTKSGDRMLPFQGIISVNGGVKVSSSPEDWKKSDGTEGYFFLSRDLLDQQVIDVHGRKVVRVNDVDLHEEVQDHRVVLKVEAVDVGVRGAVRRLLKGVVPLPALKTLLRQLPERPIPWDFVDLIETDPARRVKLKISHDRLAKLHPADIADIIEELAPDEREAVFETLDEEVAAGALEEVDPKVQKAIVESLDSDRVAGIVEEMEPDAAADLLADLPEERSSQILKEMAPAEREEVTELLEFKENTAAGRMNPDFLSLDLNATVEEAIGALRDFEGGVETVNTLYLVDSRGILAGAVPLMQLVMAKPEDRLLSLTQEPLVSCQERTNDLEVAELFDKYNLLTLPVLDDEKKLIGVITSDDVISMLRSKL
jgi:sporulation protein YlmC with PRC-barrel domain/CBS domain-containing protein